MLTRNRDNEIVFECDDCGTELDTQTRDFDEARTALREADWRTSKDGDKWVHHCPECKD